ncbi:mannose-P-dolichol utilization defect 1 protein isoform X1 [Calonectris borealis]|uniref:mannose-P-dolichol utilization defect 1 protein isoform X1 n=1 Tax=Calonectris borealis TaxID=1323832 RepID=UPI003F4B71D2
MEALRGWLVPFLLPERCFEELVLRLHVLHVPCLKILLSKALGYGIVAGSVMVKLPQVLKVVGARSGGGLSLPAVLLELLALGGSVAYGCARAFPFSAWGEALFLLLQTLALGFLIQHFGGHTGRAAAGGHQLPAGPHGAALGGLHRPPAGGGPGPRLHLPAGDGGRAAGRDLRRLGRLQRAPAGPAALLRGGPPPQAGLRPPRDPQTPGEPPDLPQPGDPSPNPWGPPDPGDPPHTGNPPSSWGLPPPPRPPPPKGGGGVVSAPPKRWTKGWGRGWDTPTGGPRCRGSPPPQINTGDPHGPPPIKGQPPPLPLPPIVVLYF